MIKVMKVKDDACMAKALLIREKVFVMEQNVPREEEYDQFENESIHFLAFCDEKECGTARWRFTEKGIKLERFAVLESHRNRGIGAALLQYVLDDIGDKPELKYLHAQLSAVSLYEKFGFQKEGGLFKECDILHFKMIKK